MGALGTTRREALDLIRSEVGDVEIEALSREPIEKFTCFPARRRSSGREAPRKEALQQRKVAGLRKPVGGFG
jgi:hypothetical protein